MPLEFLISALVTLLVVVDPIGLVPSHLAIMHGLPQHARRSVALHATLIAAAILVGSALVGDWMLRTLSIGLPAFRIAAVIVIVLALCFVVLVLAAQSARRLDVAANIVASRLLGVLLAALAVQYVVDGVRAVLAS